MRLHLHRATRNTTVLSSRRTVSTRTAKRSKIIDETTLAGAQHKVSLSGPSLGHLISELSATRPGMEHVRGPGRAMEEEQRTMIRNVVKAIVVVPSVIGAAIVGYNYYFVPGLARHEREYGPAG